MNLSQFLKDNDGAWRFSCLEELKRQRQEVLLPAAQMEISTDFVQERLPLNGYSEGFAVNPLNLEIFTHASADDLLDKELIFIEVQRGDYFGEDDIVRIEDDYGRNTK